MEAYTSFAQVYDLFMDNVPYEKWCSFIHEILQKNQIEENIVLDLACGTGKMTRLLAEKGYDMIGIDSSAEMLEIAREQEYNRIMELAEEENPVSQESPGKEEIPEADESALSNKIFDADQSSDAEKTARFLDELGTEEEYYDHAYEGPSSSTLYLCQDMRELELYGTIGACICSCNSLNYIMEEKELKKIFQLVNNYLYPGGLFIFDMNSEYKYRNLLADRTIAETRPEGSFIWDNYYEEKTHVNEYDLTLFIREDLLYDEEDSAEDFAENTQVPYYRFNETHFQKSYSLETIRKLLEEAGMEFLAAYDNYTEKPVTETTEIITVIAREKGKN